MKGALYLATLLWGALVFSSLMAAANVVPADVAVDPAGPVDVAVDPAGPVDGVAEPAGPVDGVAEPERPVDGVADPMRPVDGIDVKPVDPVVDWPTYARPKSCGCRGCVRTSRVQSLGTVDLRTGAVKLTPLGQKNVVVQAMMDPTPSCKDNCDVRGLLKVNVNANSMVRFDLTHNTPYTGFATFDIGDSQYNNGYGGNCEYHYIPPNPYSYPWSNDCAEMHSIVEDYSNAALAFYSNYMPGVDAMTTSPSVLMNIVPRTLTPSMSLWAGHQYMAANNNNNFQVCYDNDFVFLPQSPIASPNNDIYFGMNRVISDPTYRSGAGLCQASLYLIENC